MAIDVFSTTLGNLEIFRGLDSTQIGAVARNAERMVFRQGHAIITAGVAGDAAFVIVGGDAVAQTDEASAELPVVPGTLVGEMAMLIEHDYRVSVIARGQVKALKLTRQAMYDLMQRDPQLAEHFVARVASRLTRVAVELRRIDETLALASEMGHLPGIGSQSSGLQPHV